MSDWKQDLHQSIVEHDTTIQVVEQEKSQQNVNIEEFFRLKVVPAFEDFKAALEEYGREITIGKDRDAMTIKVMFKGMEEMKYGVEAKLYGTRAVAHPLSFGSDGGKPYKGQGFFRSGSQDYSIDDLSKEEILQHLLSEYKSRLKYPGKNRYH